MSVTSEGAEPHEDSPQLKQYLEQVVRPSLAAMDAAAAEATDAPPAPEEGAEGPGEPPEADAETFPRAYVEELRGESQRYRERMNRAEQLAEQRANGWHTELVRATGKLADPADLPFDESHLEDPEKLNADLDALLSDKPHYRNRTPFGEIGQGRQGSASKPLNLMQALKDLT